MSQRIRDIMTSNPRTIDADKSVAYAAKMMREEDVGVAPIVEGEKLIGLLTDRDISVRVAAQGRDPDQVKVREVASNRLVTIHPQQDLDEALRIMAKHQVRRLPVVEEDGRLVGVVAQADIAREGDDRKTGQLVEKISESGGQMSSFEEGQQFGAPIEGPQIVEPVIEHEEPQPAEEESISRVSAASSRGRKRTTRKKSTPRKGTRARTTGRRKKATGARKKAGTARKTTRRKATGARKKAGARKVTRRKATGARKKAGTARKTTRRRKKS